MKVLPILVLGRNLEELSVVSGLNSRKLTHSSDFFVANIPKFWSSKLRKHYSVTSPLFFWEEKSTKFLEKRGRSLMMLSYIKKLRGKIKIKMAAPQNMIHPRNMWGNWTNHFSIIEIVLLMMRRTKCILKPLGQGKSSGLIQGYIVSIQKLYN